ncbi:hypothetical protein GOBAR_AA31690 [Gossypium barbadense]|uniref:Uncharacterized protein n=1 Tax=Gossypium barbadense TaxID=3634 RepID=A0A2P5WD39_GOSBA|nr:hypothetical protein GOBAR_AA31690 [Gossypium barbadense]
MGLDPWPMAALRSWRGSVIIFIVVKKNHVLGHGMAPPREKGPSRPWVLRTFVGTENEEVPHKTIALGTGQMGPHHHEKPSPCKPCPPEDMALAC